MRKKNNMMKIITLPLKNNHLNQGLEEEYLRSLKKISDYSKTFHVLNQKIT